MATVSFDRDIIITNERSVDKIVEGLMKNESNKTFQKVILMKN